MPGSFPHIVRAAALAALAAGCGPAPSQRTAIPLGAVIDRTGNNAEPSWTQAIELARSHANAALAQDATLAKFEFQVVLGDSANDPAVSVRRATDLVKNRGVRGLILDSTQNDLAINRLAYDSDGSNDLGVPLVCGECTGDTINDAAATDPALRNEQGWNFRAVMASSATTRVIARLLSTQGSSGNGDVNLDRRFKVGVYTANEPFGQSFSAQMRAAAELYGPQRPQPAMVSVETSFHPRDAETNSYEWRQDLDRLSDASPDGIPDAIVVATFAQYHAAFVRSFKGSYNVRVLHAHNFRIDSAIQSLGTLGDEEEGVSAPLVAPGETGETFTSQFTAATGLSPTFLDSVYYDAAAALMLAAVAAGGDDPSQLTGEQLRAGLRTINQPGGEAVGAGADGIARAISALRDGRAINYSGASGPLDFDAQGNVRSLLTHYRSASGKFTELTTFDCITDPECPAQ